METGTHGSVGEVRWVIPAIDSNQSSFGWRQAQSKVSTETYLEVYGCKISGNPTGYSIKRW